MTTTPRRRDATATRRALLDAARALVTEHGVEGTSTRDIAAAAGVNQALVYRYFGSKEKLLTEAVGDSMSEVDDLFTDTPLADLPLVLLDRMLDPENPMRSGLTAVMTAANDETIRTLIRDRIGTLFGSHLATRLDGPDAAVRAELLAALIIGIGFLREKIGTHALAAADRETLAPLVDHLATRLLNGRP
ncbi:TetR/AcrR family transcriptional regulator [Actinokineospora enzanensis]|uniref:TetR/AcrR family transcriptional regulator n=1 Tax=Actinokineospora enzanensis TaxID=155975 RepID=UPI000370E882|nr:TetR/AcrR family transcriptional regulator [Actinokineospora enzanensis]